MNEAERKHAEARLRGKCNRKKGNKTEEMAVKLLVGLGYKCVHRIATPYSPGLKKYTAKVQGDITAVTDKGMGVLCECKERDQLQYSHFASHQHERLHGYEEAGAIAFVLWHKPKKGYLLAPYCAFVSMGLRPRKSLSSDWGKWYTVADINSLYRNEMRRFK